MTTEQLIVISFYFICFKKAELTIIKNNIIKKKVILILVSPFSKKRKYRN